MKEGEGWMGSQNSLHTEKVTPVSRRDMMRPPATRSEIPGCWGVVGVGLVISVKSSEIWEGWILGGGKSKWPVHHWKWHCLDVCPRLPQLHWGSGVGLQLSYRRTFNLQLPHRASLALVVGLRSERFFSCRGTWENWRYFGQAEWGNQPNSVHSLSPSSWQGMGQFQPVVSIPTVQVKSSTPSVFFVELGISSKNRYVYYGKLFY